MPGRTSGSEVQAGRKGRLLQRARYGTPCSAAGTFPKSKPRVRRAPFQDQNPELALLKIRGELAEKAFDVHDQADGLKTPPIRELRHHRRVDVDAYRRHRRGQQVASGD